ncbi:GDSL-type esterase/lipase family protein [Methylobacterium sp. 10]|uniref:GDSL-type esterase/lipase family protein n=1 Tax=Methylobacterium sp. 10 TaxID=1101191 RepID=UPI0004B4294E|nr:GDSL-type esterase/lipase family protein [Methylobacterium sp. 10]
MYRTLLHSIFGLALLCAAGPGIASPGCPALAPRQPMPLEAIPQSVSVAELRERSAPLSAQVSGQDLSANRLVFLGDSITQGWDPGLWGMFWGEWSPLNLGLWGDRTQDVLWRLDHGQWPPSLKPDLVVLLIGTNNAGTGSRPEDTALGIAEIIRVLQARSPDTRILLLGILPRGEDATAPERVVNARVNELIRRCHDDKRVIYLDPGRAMVDAAGHLSPQVMADRLHPTSLGYAILGGAIDARIRQLMRR